MLTKIREKTQGIIATVIVAFVAIPFVLWGIGSYFDGGATVTVAKVNGVEISQGTYRERLEEIQRANPRSANNSVLKQLVLESLIDQTLMTSQAQDSGYRVSDAQLAVLIHEIPDFQRDGKFQPGLYDAVLNAQGLRPTDFEARVRHASVTTQVQQAFSESAFVTEAELATTLRLRLQERRISYALVSAEAFLAKTTVSAKDVDDYYQANQESFLAPEAVRVDYVSLKTADVAQEVEPTEAQTRQTYEAEAARYVTPAKRRISHILISLPSQTTEQAVQAAKTRAENLLKQIRDGADFAALARKDSGDALSAKTGGDLGDVAPGVLPPELEAAASALKEGEVSEPIRTSFGYHLVKLTGLSPERRKSYDAVKPELQDLVRRRLGEERFYELSERFRNLVYENPEGLEAVAAALSLKVERSDWFTRAGGSGVAAQPRVASAAFEPDVLSRARNSDAIEADPQTLIALHVVDHRPAVVRPLTEVRSTIEKTLKESRSRGQVQAVTQQWVKELEQGKAIAELAREPGVTLHAAQTLTRERPGDVSAAIVEAVFGAPRSKDKPTIGQVDLGKQGTAIYALEAVKDVDPATADAALKAKVRQQLRVRNGADYYASFRSGLRKVADIKINADQL